MRALRWSRNPSPYTAGKPEAVRGQYRIWQDPGSHFRVLHVSRISKTGELSECIIGETDTLDNAKALAQTHADLHGRKKPADAATADAIERQKLAAHDPRQMNRLVACVAFSGDLKPNASAAAVALARSGYEVTLMPERYRPLLCHPRDDFLEAFKRVRGNEETIASATSGMMDEVNAIVDAFGGDCFESGAVEDDYVADFCGLTRDDRVIAANKQQA